MNTHGEKFEEVAAVVCGKLSGLSAEDCFCSQKAGYSPCRGYSKCCLFEKSEQQLNFVLHSLDVEAFLKACPGSGKTEVVGLMAAYAMRQKAWRHQGIAVLSFTNNAADVIRERVQRFAGNSGFPHYVGTFDSWLHGYLLNPYGHLFTHYQGKNGDWSIRVVSNNADSPFLYSYQTKYQYGQCGYIKANHFFFDSGSEEIMFDSGQDGVDGARRNLAWNGWQRGDLEKTKERFWRDGFATHQDIELICLRLLEMPNEVAKRLAQRFPYLVVDECQDLSFGQLQILESLRQQGSRVHLVGDLNQAIYSFRKVYPERVREFIDKNRMEVLPLTRNFRSVQPIVDVCGRLLEQGAVEGHPIKDEQPVCVYFTYKGKTIEALPKRFETFAKERGCLLEGTAVLARGYSTLRKLSAFDPDVPDNLSKCLALAIYLWNEADAKTLDNALKCVGLASAHWLFPGEHHDHRNQGRPETVKSNMEWRLFLARVLEGCIRHAAISNLQQTWKVWAACTRKGFGSILADAWKSSVPLPISKINVRSPSGEGDSKVFDTLGFGNPANRCSLRMSTFHKIKGETLDAAFVVSSPTRNGDGGHWLQWIDQTAQDEHRRYAYVASSRPKHLLAWAIPEPNDEQKQVLEKLGFSPV